MILIIKPKILVYLYGMPFSLTFGTARNAYGASPRLVPTGWARCSARPWWSGRSVVRSPLGHGARRGPPLSALFLCLFLSAVSGLSDFPGLIIQ